MTPEKTKNVSLQKKLCKVIQISSCEIHVGGGNTKLFSTRLVLKTDPQCQCVWVSHSMPRGFGSGVTNLHEENIGTWTSRATNIKISN